MRRPYISAADKRRRAQAALGAFYIAAGVIIMATWCGLAIGIDRANGMTIGQSLASWGL